MPVYKITRIQPSLFIGSGSNLATKWCYSYWGAYETINYKLKNWGSSSNGFEYWWENKYVDNNDGIDTVSYAPDGYLYTKIGSYTGNSLDNRTISTAFTVDAVIVQGEDSTSSEGAAVMLIRTASSARGVTSGSDCTTSITLPSTNNFRVNHTASGAHKTNKSGIKYHYIAIGSTIAPDGAPYSSDKAVAFGSYSGNSSTQSITGLAFKPYLLFIQGPGSAVRWKSSAVPSNKSLSFSNESSETDAITSLDSTGFTLGSNSSVNQSGNTYYYIAFHESYRLSSGSYTGNGINNHIIPEGSLEPNLNYIHIKSDSSRKAIFKSNSITGFSVLQYDNGNLQSNRVSEYDNGYAQIKLGTDLETNNSSETYYYFSFLDGQEQTKNPGYKCIRVNGKYDSYDPENAYVQGGTPYITHFLKPANIQTKEGTIFPVDKTKSWTLEWKMRGKYEVPTSALKTYIATAFRVCGIDNTSSLGGSIVGIDCNQFLGTQIGLPDGTWLETLPTSDTDWHTYSLYWSGGNPISAHNAYTYYLSRDGVEYGTSLPGGIGGVVTRGADFISIGKQGITNNIPAVFTPIEVQYIRLSGTNGDIITETHPNGLTEWPKPIKDYEDFWGITIGENNVWDEINGSGMPGDILFEPYLKSGRISKSIDQEYSSIEIVFTAQNPYDINDKNVWSDFSFLDKMFSFHGYEWNEQYQEYFYSDAVMEYVIIEEAEYTIENGELIITLRGRYDHDHAWSKLLFNRSYGVYPGSLKNMNNGYSIFDIEGSLSNLAFFTDPEVDPPTTDPYFSYKAIIDDLQVELSNKYDVNAPTLNEYSGSSYRINEVNFVNETARSVIDHIVEDLASVIYDRTIKPYTEFESGGTPGTVHFSLSVYNEIILINYVSYQAVSQIELTFDDANGNPYVAVYPVNPWPNNGIVLNKSSNALYDSSDIASNNPLHVFHWQRENMHIGEIEVTCSISLTSQSYLETGNSPEYTIGSIITIEDDIFLGISPTIRWVITGVEYLWEGSNIQTVKYICSRVTFDKINWIRNNL